MELINQCLFFMSVLISCMADWLPRIITEVTLLHTEGGLLSDLASTDTRIPDLVRKKLV